jgi:acyl-coenzyme A synthetase/AMP-(fatty) acid ligase
MSPTEYRMIAAGTSLDGRKLPALRRLVSAGEPLNPEVIDVFDAALGLSIHDGYGQTETGQLTGMPLGIPARPGSMGIPLPGMRVDVDDGELVADPDSIPTFFLRYLGEDAPPAGLWRTGDRVTRDDEGFLHFVGRTDDVIISAGYRIGPFEVESVLNGHPAVLESAAIAIPDEIRGEVLEAHVVLNADYTGSPELAAELQHLVKTGLAAHAYPRNVIFIDEMPKTPSGKVQRFVLRDQRRRELAS